LIEFAVDTGNIQDVGQFASGKRDGFGEVVPVGEHTQGNEDIEVLLGRQTQVGVPLDLPQDAGIGAIRQRFASLDFQLAYAFAHAAFENSKWDDGQILLFNGQVDEGGLPG